MAMNLKKRRKIDVEQDDAANIHQSSSVEVDNLCFPDSMDIETIKAARLRRQNAPTLQELGMNIIMRIFLRTDIRIIPISTTYLQETSTTP